MKPSRTTSSCFQSFRFGGGGRVKVMGKRTLKSHDISTGALHHLCNHIVDKAVLIPDLLLVKGLLVSALKDLLEDILESSIILLEDSVLGAQIEREALLERKVERRVCEALNGLIGVILGLSNTASGELEDLELLWLAAVLWGEDEG
jgi:hypothetical protein